MTEIPLAILYIILGYFFFFYQGLYLLCSVSAQLQLTGRKDL